MENRVRLGGILHAREPLRYSPAGIPIVDATIAHRSGQSQAGHLKEVEFEARVVAVDATALRLGVLPLGAQVRMSGFLAPRRRHARSLVLHVTELETIERNSNSERG